nr:hypothetical protein [Salinispora arenicola]
MSPVLVSTYSAVTAAGVGEQALAGWLADRDGANADPGVPVGGPLRRRAAGANRARAGRLRRAYAYRA